MSLLVGVCMAYLLISENTDTARGQFPKLYEELSKLGCHVLVILLWFFCFGFFSL